MCDKIAMCSLPASNTAWFAAPHLCSSSWRLRIAATIVSTCMFKGYSLKAFKSSVKTMMSNPSKRTAQTESPKNEFHKHGPQTVPCHMIFNKLNCLDFAPPTNTKTGRSRSQLRMTPLTFCAKQMYAEACPYVSAMTTNKVLIHEKREFKA